MTKYLLLIKKHKFKTIAIVILLIVYYCCLPKVLFTSPTATVITANNGRLLGASIAKDGQWRFPEIDSVPYKFEQCILQFEDAHFYKHPGFNPVAIGKALLANIKAKRVVRGGSTITQQVIRLSRKNTKRSYTEKLKELILATRLEFRHSKAKILQLYASHAPFGGNVVGLEMAAWRYYKLQPHQLSWAETATLAVLPNAPSLIFPGRNQQRLKNKRDKLLNKLLQQGIIDSITHELAIAEELPQKPYDLPEIAPHLVQEIQKNTPGIKLETTVDYHIQQRVNEIVKSHYTVQQQNQVYNMAVLVLNVENRNVVAYVGNTPTDDKHEKDINNIVSNRSTGSTLKPILYAHAMQVGELLPKQLVADIPTQIAGYTPKNFNLKYGGAVPADEALTRSLNIPAVRLLRSYGLAKFRDDIDEYQIKGIKKSADYYGLSLILGGAEASLWDLCKTYAGYAAVVNNYEKLKHNYYTNEFVNPNIYNNKTLSFGEVKAIPNQIDAGSAYLTLETLTNVNRPLSDQAWKYYDSSQKIAWKTGTSFGGKDAWAIGATPKYVVGVWVGNSDGEGRPELTGVGSAGPVLFDVFDVLPKSEWFLTPYEDLLEEKVCKTSGYLALPICPSEKQYIAQNGIRAKSCPYHKQVTVNTTEHYQVNSSCAPLNSIKTKTWFVLPPLMASFYKQHNANYRNLPAFKPGCFDESSKSMDFVYPTEYYTRISLTKDESGEINPIVIKLTHNNSETEIFWYLNDKYIGTTNDFHELAIQPELGKHKLTVIDSFGNEIHRMLEVF